MAIYDADDRLSLAFGALADPTRRAILGRLASGEADVAELTRPFGLSQPTISKHLKVLERAGLVVRGRDAQRRPRALVAAPLQDIDAWLEPYRQLWEARFARLDAYLREVQAPPDAPVPRKQEKQGKQGKQGKQEKQRQQQTRQTPRRRPTT